MTTSTDLAQADDASLAVLPPAQPPSVAARQMLLAHAEMMQTAWQLATKMCNTQMVPARFRGKPEDGTAAILYGAELGLNPIQSLQRVIPIHGMPSMEARTMVALLKARGYRIRTSAQSNESVTVIGVDLEGDVFESTWTIERARQAGYVPEVNPQTGKFKTNANGKLIGNEKYLTDPQAMLKAKAQSEVCRDMAPDVLMGISYTSEELESENWGSDLAQQQMQAPAGRGAAITTDDILNDEPVTVDEVVQEQRQDEPEADEAQPAEPEPEPAAEDPAPDTEPATATTEPEPQPEPEPEPVKAKKTQTRTALERRLFKLLGDADIQVENREDRLIVYRFIVGRDDVTSTDDLNDVEVAKVCDSLYEWSRTKVLNDKITEILNTATIAEDNS